MEASQVEGTVNETLEAGAMREDYAHLMGVLMHLLVAIASHLGCVVV